MFKRMLSQYRPLQTSFEIEDTSENISPDLKNLILQELNEEKQKLEIQREEYRAEFAKWKEQNLISTPVSMNREIYNLRKEVHALKDKNRHLSELIQRSQTGKWNEAILQKIIYQFIEKRLVRADFARIEKDLLHRYFCHYLLKFDQMMSIHQIDLSLYLKLEDQHYVGWKIRT